MHRHRPPYAVDQVAEELGDLGTVEPVAADRAEQLRVEAAQDALDEGGLFVHDAHRVFLGLGDVAARPSCGLERAADA